MSLFSKFLIPERSSSGVNGVKNWRIFVCPPQESKCKSQRFEFLDDQRCTDEVQSLLCSVSDAFHQTAQQNQLSLSGKHGVRF